MEESNQSPKSRCGVLRMPGCPTRAVCGQGRLSNRQSKTVDCASQNLELTQPQTGIIPDGCELSAAADFLQPQSMPIGCLAKGVAIQQARLIPQGVRENARLTKDLRSTRLGVPLGGGCDPSRNPAADQGPGPRHPWAFDGPRVGTCPSSRGAQTHRTECWSFDASGDGGAPPLERSGHPWNPGS